MTDDTKQHQGGPVGWKTWGGDRCNHCCNKDRCDEPEHFDRRHCPYCKGTGRAIWLDVPADAEPRAEK